MKTKFLAIESDADGTQWTAFGGVTADDRYNRLHVLNNTGTALEFRRNGTSDVFTLPDGMAWSFAIVHLGNIEFRRVDQSNTQVTPSAEAELL